MNIELAWKASSSHWWAAGIGRRIGVEVIHTMRVVSKAYFTDLTVQPIELCPAVLKSMELN